jgi:diguanylate cyclase (GGDEF)-like protein
MRNDIKSHNTAIVMMSSSDDEQLAIDCIKAGAQDFLVKSDITVNRLKRAMLHAEVRYELESQLFDSYQKVKQLAERDSLTGLSNRYLFDETLKTAVTNNRRNVNKLALILIDVDNFKFVNDTHGHDVGDAYLVSFVQRLSQELRGNEMFARLGGDEFALILSNLESVSHASLVAKRLLNSLSKPLVLGDLEFSASASFGVAIHPDNTTTADQLFKFSDIALYRAKKLGKGQICFFQGDMQQEFVSKFLLEQELSSALKNEELILYYQPVYDTKTLKPIAFEALIRWQHPTGLRYPDQFIPVAEESHLIEDIGAWVFKEALTTINAWNKQYNQQYSIAINLSPRQMDDPQFIKQIEAIRNSIGFPAELIELELTETLFLSDVEATKATLINLRELGYRLALDDFGTGFSSISHIQNFPINTVKLDKSLLEQDKQSDKTRSLFKGLVSMLDLLGLETVAEGVELEENLAVCQQLAIDRMQGYFFSRPQPKEVIEQSILTQQ